MADCIFCAIVSGEIPTELLHSDGDVVAFRDLNPQAPTHILIIPRKHVESVSELTASDDATWAGMLHAAQSLALTEGIARSGHRLVVNTGDQGGQTVPHLHLHLLGGRPMKWPPG